MEPNSVIADREGFILSHAELLTPPLVPEISLYLASEIMTLWGATETAEAAHASRLGALPPPYWAFAWAGGQALARYVLDHPHEVAGKTVLDFGTGSGLVAIAAARAGAAHVAAAELDLIALAATALNAAANNVCVETIGHDVIGTERCWDVVLAGDMCYEQPLTGRLLCWLHGLAGTGTKVLIGDPGRNYSPATGVKRLASYAVPTILELEDREIRDTSVYLLLPD
jgi:predicted nicotinamide N-methyase